MWSIRNYGLNNYDSHGVASTPRQIAVITHTYFILVYIISNLMVSSRSLIMNLLKSPNKPVPVFETASDNTKDCIVTFLVS